MNENKPTYVQLTIPIELYMSLMQWYGKSSINDKKILGRTMAASKLVSRQFNELMCIAAKEGLDHREYKWPE